MSSQNASGAAGASSSEQRLLASVLPPLILGTATFNTQYVEDPDRMPYTAIVRRALELGVNAFDTSPYYGPSEELLGKALHTLTTQPQSSESHTAAQDSTLQQHTWSRADYVLLTKAGRIGPRSFDYSAPSIRSSVHRSLSRLHTSYLDVVYCHDVEFVTPPEVLAAVTELRRLRDEEGGVVRYVGISGYPVDVLCDLAEMILRETGEPVDVVMSYCHCTLQSQLLARGFLPKEDGFQMPDETANRDEMLPLVRLKKAGVKVIPNASMLGMGLLTTRGVDAGPQAVWHPSPRELREACKEVSGALQEKAEKLEKVAIRYSIDTWARAGGEAGVGVPLPSGRGGSRKEVQSVGASVMGVSSVAELEETWDVWQHVLAEMDGLAVSKESSAVDESKASALKRREQVLELVRGTIWPLLGEWRNHAWDSGRKWY